MVDPFWNLISVFLYAYLAVGVFVFLITPPVVTVVLLRAAWRRLP